MRKVHPKNILKNKKGQALVEYILLTFIVVVIAITVIKGIADSTESFAANYFGKYLECLLEVGELPTLGGEDGPGEGCESEFQPFTLAEGRPPISPDGAGGESGDSDADRNNNNNQNGDNSSSIAASTSDSGGSDGGGGGGLGSGGFNGRPSRVPLSGEDKKNSAKLASSDSGGSGLYNFEQDEDFGDDGFGRSEYVPVYSGNLDDKEKEVDEKTVKTNVDQNPEQALRGRRVPATAEKSKNADIKPDEGITLPNFIKYLIIAAIILVIIIFFGGQVMQFQKSKD